MTPLSFWISKFIYDLNLSLEALGKSDSITYISNGFDIM